MVMQANTASHKFVRKTCWCNVHTCTVYHLVRGDLSRHARRREPRLLPLVHSSIIILSCLPSDNVSICLWTDVLLQPIVLSICAWYLPRGGTNPRGILCILMDHLQRANPLYEAIHCLRVCHALCLRKCCGTCRHISYIFGMTLAKNVEHARPTYDVGYHTTVYMKMILHEAACKPETRV